MQLRIVKPYEAHELLLRVAATTIITDLSSVLPCRIMRSLQHLDGDYGFRDYTVFLQAARVTSQRGHLLCTHT